jgi:uncharacterized Zn-binding protein involved in type VI secretion
MFAALYEFFFSLWARTSTAKAVARQGDPLSRGGTITGACSPNVTANGLAVARLGDTVTCAIHGAQTITSASGSVTVNGLGVARVGDTLSCGDTISGGSPSVVAGA